MRVEILEYLNCGCHNGNAYVTTAHPYLAIENGRAEKRDGPMARGREERKT